MTWVRIYAPDRTLYGRREVISDLLHRAEVAELGVPEGRRVHHFVTLDREDVFVPAGRADFLVVEVLLRHSCSAAAKKTYFRSVYDEFAGRLGVAPDDVEIVLREVPGTDWAAAGVPADELAD